MESREPRAEVFIMAVRWVLASLFATGVVAPLAGQTVQYRSPAGVEYRSLPESGAVARAEQALAADPRNVDLIIALGVAQSGVLQFREAIATFTRGLAIAPDNAMLYRWRGHRYISVREFDRAMADLTRGYGLDSLNYGILFHLGVLRFAQGDFHGAADAFRRGQKFPPNAGELAGSTDWLWMSLMRAGRAAEAKAMLASRHDSHPPGYGYTQRLRLYRGEIGPDQVFTPADTAAVQVATLSYGVGNWYQVRGDSAKAREWFERVVQSGGWAAFGFIVAERELGRDEQRRDEQRRDEQRRDEQRRDEQRRESAEGDPLSSRGSEGPEAIQAPMRRDRFALTGSQ